MIESGPGPARPTMRCLREDLTSEWGDASQFRAVLEQVPVTCALHDIDHPVVRHGAAVWPAGPPTIAERESISGLSDPPYWKLKTGRWRGAVYVDPADGQAWIVAAGLRQAGNDGDFYRRFMSQVASGTELLPTDEDRERLKLERAEERLAAWEVAVRDAAAEAFARAAAARRAAFDLYGVGCDTVLASVVVEVEVVAEDDATESIVEVVVSVETKDRTRPSLVEHSELVVLAAVCPDEQLWDASHTGTANMYSIVVSHAEFQSLLVSTGTRAPGETSAGREAHWTHRGRLAEKSVTGEATRALCGIWFVPRQDPVGLPPCEQCAAVQRVLTQLRPNS